MIDDEFFLDDDELNADFELSPAAKEKIKILDVMEKIIADLKDNINLCESGDEKTNFSILSGYVTYINKIMAMESSNNVSEAQILSELKEIDEHVREMAYEEVTLDIEEDDGTQSGLDFLPSGSTNDDFDF